MRTNIYQFKQESKTAVLDRELLGQLVLCPPSEYLHLYAVLHAPTIKKRLNIIAQSSGELEEMLKHYQLSTDYSLLPSDDVYRFLELTELLRSVFRDMNVFCTHDDEFGINKPYS